MADNTDPNTHDEAKPARKRGRPKTKFGTVGTTVDMAAPFFVVFSKSQDRRVFDVFQGEDAEAHAKAHASGVAFRSTRTVAVLGPQIAVYQPPVHPTADEVQLDWMKP